MSHRQNLIQRLEGGENFDYTFFWGHYPRVRSGVNKSCLSQWWGGHSFNVPVSVPWEDCEQNLVFSSMEQFMMARKAALFNDRQSWDSIMESTHPSIAKELGRKVKNFDDNIWVDNRWDIVVRGNYAKFSQHEELSDFLLNTGETVLVEASPYDLIWGVGLNAMDPLIKDPRTWRGLNLLGFALMEVRIIMINEFEKYKALSYDYKPQYLDRPECEKHYFGWDHKPIANGGDGPGCLPGPLTQGKYLLCPACRARAAFCASDTNQIPKK